MTGEQRFQNGLVAMQQEAHLGMAATGNRGPGKDRRRTGIAAHRIKRKNQFPDHVLTVPPARCAAKRLDSGKRPNRRASVLSGNNLAAIIVSTCRTDMVGPLQFATIGAFAAGLDAKRMMRPAHIALGRRGLSFWNRHGETLHFLRRTAKALRLKMLWASPTQPTANYRTAAGKNRARS